MTRRLLFASIIAILALSSTASAYDVQQKTDALIAALSKTKVKEKQKGLIQIRLFIDVKNEPVEKVNAADYSGTYRSQDDGYSLELSVREPDEIEGHGFDAFSGEVEPQHFTLRDARIEGALLTATKVFSNGAAEELEAVFVRRTVVSGRSPSEIESRNTAFGLGFIQKSYGENINRVFLEAN